MRRKLLSQVSPVALCWPEGKPRSKSRACSRFKKKTEAQAAARLARQLRSAGVKNYVISATAGSEDPAIACWFEAPGPERMLRVLASDAFPTRWENTHAMAETLEQMRRVERWRVIDVQQAMEALAPPLAIAPPRVREEWWQVLGVRRNGTLEEAEAAWRQLAKRAHPDRGGDEQSMSALNAAISAARKQLIQT